MAHFFKLIPEQPDLVNVVVPYFSLMESGEDIRGVRSTVAFYPSLYGANIDFKDEYYYSGPKVKTDLTDVVLGVDEVNFVAFSNDLKIPEDSNLQNIRSYEPLDRYVREKIFDQGFYDYDNAVKDGTELISSLGLRCGTYNFYGNLRYFNLQEVEENKEVKFVIAVPNNRELHPCLSFVTTEDSLDLSMFDISMLKKDYYNFYLSRQKITNGTYMFGFFNLASVAVVYYADTGVYIDGIRDHQE